MPVLNGWDIKLGVISTLGSSFLLLRVLEMLVRGLSILHVPVGVNVPKRKGRSYLDQCKKRSDGKPFSMGWFPLALLQAPF